MSEIIYFGSFTFKDKLISQLISQAFVYIKMWMSNSNLSSSCHTSVHEESKSSILNELFFIVQIDYRLPICERYNLQQPFFGAIAIRYTLCYE